MEQQINLDSFDFTTFPREAHVDPIVAALHARVALLGRVPFDAVTEFVDEAFALMDDDTMQLFADIENNPAHYGVPAEIEWGRRDEWAVWHAEKVAETVPQTEKLIAIKAFCAKVHAFFEEAMANERSRHVTVQ